MVGCCFGVGVTKSMGVALLGFADYFERNRPDIVVILGDRYEALMAATAAMMARIPIAHIHGGETTEGAVDEAIRHSITKMSHLHFTAAEAYRNRVIQLGEQPQNVYHVGALGVENVRSVSLLDRKTLEDAIQFTFRSPAVMVTYHPVTLEKNSAEEQAKELMRACGQFPGMNFIFTKANSDASGRMINEMLADFAEAHANMRIYDSLGLKRYLSAVKYAKLVLGNSSSGIMEVPSFGIPTVNIGDRQRGRMRAESIIDCEPSEKDIAKAINLALDDDFQNLCRTCKNPYEGENPSGDIVKIIQSFVDGNRIDLKKKFYNIDF